METLLGEIERGRAIFELAVGQPRLDMPEVLWKAYIDFEMEEREFDNIRSLYRRLLQRTHHVKVSIGIVILLYIQYIKALLMPMFVISLFNF